MSEGRDKLLERLLVSVDRAYHQPKLLIWRGFLIGLASGAGGIIGAALVIALIGLLIRVFGGLPVIGEWLVNVGQKLPTESF